QRSPPGAWKRPRSGASGRIEVSPTRVGAKRSPRPARAVTTAGCCRRADRGVRHRAAVERVAPGTSLPLVLPQRGMTNHTGDNARPTAAGGGGKVIGGAG